MFTKKKRRYYSLVITVFALLLSACCLLTSFSKTNVPLRTVQLDESGLDYNDLSLEFDDYNVQTNEKDVDIVANKKFDSSILSELDMVSLNDEAETFTVRYQVTYIDVDSTVFLTVTMLGADEIPVIDTIPGLISHNAAGKPDVMFAVDDEFIWLSDLTGTGAIDQVGFFKNLFKKVQKAVLAVSQSVVKIFAPILKPAVMLTNEVMVLLLGSQNAAKLGALALNMAQDEQGIYHAIGDCWQQYFGYTDLYDTVFNAVTSMRSEKFEFDIDNDGVDDYVLWAWKGDYLNLGAGAELGIYKRWDYSDDIWIVDKSNAMEMTLKLDYKGETIIYWIPKQKQWWITGFNPKAEYKNVNRDDLTATYTVTFNNGTLYNKFKDKYKKEEKRIWNFSNYLEVSYVF